MVLMENRIFYAEIRLTHCSSKNIGGHMSYLVLVVAIIILFIQVINK